MFRGFAEVWTPIALARTLRADRPLAFEVAGERVVVFRDREGRARALRDVCPHRGVKLSLGRVEDGCITCPFHGWVFDGDGACVHVPWNPDAKRETLGVTSFPVRERGGLLWLYTAPVAEAPREPDVAPFFGQQGVRLAATELVWKTHWTRAMENMLDWPHLPFVHAGTIGRGMLKRRDARMDVSWEDRPYGAHTRIRIDDVDQDGYLDFRAPNQMLLFIPIPRRFMVMTVACIPIDDERTRMLLVGARDFLTAAIFDPVFNWSNKRIASEDQAVLESSFPVEVPAPEAERSVRTDKPVLQFRKLYRRQLRASGREDGVRPLRVVGD